MKNSAEKVLIKLNRRGSKGVSVDQFPTGFRLAARINDLRVKYEIKTVMEEVSYGRRARYFYIGELETT